MSLQNPVQLLPCDSAAETTVRISGKTAKVENAKELLNHTLSEVCKSIILCVCLFHFYFMNQML